MKKKQLSKTLLLTTTALLTVISLSTTKPSNVHISSSGSSEHSPVQPDQKNIDTDEPDISPQNDKEDFNNKNE